MERKLFKELKIGETFDFINDEKPGYNTFFLSCRKTSNRNYVDTSGCKHLVGSINAIVYHVGITFE